jgi:hypothetical protein
VIPKRQLIKVGAPILALLNSVPSCKAPLTPTPRKLLKMVSLPTQRVGARLQLTPLAGMHPLLTQLHRISLAGTRLQLIRLAGVPLHQERLRMAKPTRTEKKARNVASAAMTKKRITLLHWMSTSRRNVLKTRPRCRSLTVNVLSMIIPNGKVRSRYSKRRMSTLLAR